jgi:hypothetical protein
MALLSTEDRKKRFKYLGLGDYNKDNILKFQKKAFPNNSAEHDAKYGIHTDRALRTFYNVKRFGGGYFKPSEFKCTCGHCCGYPSFMKKVQIEHLRKIREHYDKPMVVTSGLRCSYENSRVGGVANSGHTKGYATDFYMQGVTDTVANRTKALAWMKKQSNHEFTYGANMADSNGLYRSADGMGNAMHTETHKPKADHLQKWYDAMKEQYQWSKNQKYEFDDHPTVENSKKKGTCITFPAVSLQRIKLLPKGGYFYYHPTKHYISGNSAKYVMEHPEKFKLSYPNKTFKELIKDDRIKKGDIVGFGNPAYHTMVYMGTKTVTRNGKKVTVPKFNTMGHKKGLGVTYPMYEDRKVNMLVRIKKV